MIIIQHHKHPCWLCTNGVICTRTVEGFFWPAHRIGASDYGKYFALDRDARVYIYGIANWREEDMRWSRTSSYSELIASKCLKTKVHLTSTFAWSLINCSLFLNIFLLRPRLLSCTNFFISLLNDWAILGCSGLPWAHSRPPGLPSRPLRVPG